MQPIRIAYVQNLMSRTLQGLVQEMTFMLELENLSYEKRVEIHWSGEDGHWHTEAATYSCTLPSQREYWLVTVHCPLTSDHPLPGNIRFAARYETGGRTFWDNNHGHNYALDADCGVVVYGHLPLLHLFPEPVLHGGKVSLQVNTAVRAALGASQVYVHWSTDHWQTRGKVRCVRRANEWDLARASAARNPNRYGWEIWTARLPVHQAYRVEYAIECITEKGVFWENNHGANYQSRRGTLRVMTLNLHCNQEENQAAKLRQIARAIEQLDIDFICLQEVAEDWNEGRGDWASNTAHILNNHLPVPYHLHTDFSHLGFDRYREGVAILSRYEFSFTDSGYVSESTDVYDIHARRVVMAQVHVPYLGPINLFSAHLSWPEDGFELQFERLCNWANDRHTDDVVATLLCGDFNVRADSETYRRIVESREYEDQFLQAIRPADFERLYRSPPGSEVPRLDDDGRIDFIWLKRGSRLRLLDGRELFTPHTYGRVSDHTGYLAEFELL